MRLAEERKPLIQAYLNDVIKLQRISESRPAQTFFRRRPGDPNDDDPLLKNENLAESEVADFEENLKLVIDQESSKGNPCELSLTETSLGDMGVIHAKTMLKQCLD